MHFRPIGLSSFLARRFSPFVGLRQKKRSLRRQRRAVSTAAVELLESRTLLSAATAEVFHVSVGGTDAGDGSQANPWRTLQFAADRVGAGDTVIVHAGTYAGFDLRVDGTASQRITFRAEDGVTINQQNSRTTDGINLEGADYVTIEGFRIVGVPRAGIRSVVNHHVVIRDNVLDQNGVWGVFTAFSDDVTIENNVASRSVRQHGIYVSNSGDRPVIRGNEIFSNYQNGIHMNGDLSAGGDGIITGAIVEQNVIYDNGRGGGSGINADGVQNSRFANNLLYNNHASGIALYRINAGAGSSGNTVINNTILNASDSRWAVTISDGSINNTLLNNIIHNAHSFRGSITVEADSLAGLVSDYNIIMDRFSNDNGNTRISLSHWRAATGQDLHSIIATPGELFVDPATGNYHLKAGSRAIDAGTSLVTLGVDFEGDARPQGARIDIGADEFLSNSPPPPPPTSDFAAGFDFGTAGSPVASGYTQIVGGALYSASLGYGWTTKYWTGASDRGGADALTRDSVSSQLGTFAVDVPAGTYDVTVTVGDLLGISDQVQISLEGAAKGTLSATPGNHVTGTYRVQVSDGQLTIDLDDLGGAGRYFYLNAIQIQQVTGSNPPPASDITGPRVLSAEALGSANQLDGFRITFSEAIPDAGLALSHVSLAGPLGAVVPTSLTRLSATQFEVRFPIQSAAGLYTLSISPLVTDQAGNRMDQDGDGVQGELIDDQFRATAELFATDLQAGFDFGTATSPVAPGYQRATAGMKYNSTTGYGWTVAYWTGNVDRGTTDPLTRDAIVTQAGTFAVDLANGTYDVTITIGDLLGVSDNLSVSLENQDAGMISAAAGQHTSRTFRVQVTDGQLTIKLDDVGGLGRYFYLNAIHIRSV